MDAPPIDDLDTGPVEAAVDETPGPAASAADDTAVITGASATGDDQGGEAGATVAPAPDDTAPPVAPPPAGAGPWAAPPPPPEAPAPEGAPPVAPGAPPRPPAGRSATGALVLSIVAFLVAPLLLVPIVAVIVAAKARKEKLRLATPALVIGILALVVGLVVDGVLVVGVLADDDEGVHYSSLTVGECIARPEDALTQVEKVACTETDSLAVTLVVDDPAPPATPYPGKDALVQSVATRCSEALTATAGGADVSTMRQIQIVPTEESWDDGNRRLVCTVAEST